MRVNHALQFNAVLAQPQKLLGLRAPDALLRGPPIFRAARQIIKRRRFQAELIIAKPRHVRPASGVRSLPIKVRRRYVATFLAIEIRICK